MENKNVESDISHCYILPWLNIEEDIRIGDVTFKQADPKKLDDGSNNEIIGSLAKSMEHFVKCNGNSTDQAALCFYKDQWLFQKDFQGMQNIRDAVDILSFLVISRLNILCFNGNFYLGQPPSSEKFKLATIPLFIEGNKKPKVFYKAGVKTILLDTGKHYFDLEPTKHGYQELTEKQYDSKLLELFNHLISLPRNEEIERILRSLMWFRYSHTESDEVDPFSCILMKMTAFEILLDLPDRDARLTFMESIDNNYVEIFKNELSFFEFVKENREIQRRQVGTTVNENKNQSKLAWWAYDFYKLRSRIVHGDHLESKDQKRDDQEYNELIMADLVFSWLVSEKLQQLVEKCDSLTRHIFFDAFEKAGWLENKVRLTRFEF